MQKETILISVAMSDFQSVVRDTFRECLNEAAVYQPSHPKKYLSVKEAADYLNSTKGSIYQKHFSGALKGTKSGSRLLFSLEDLDAFLKPSSKKQS